MRALPLLVVGLAVVLAGTLAGTAVAGPEPAASPTPCRTLGPIGQGCLPEPTGEPEPEPTDDPEPKPTATVQSPSPTRTRVATSSPRPRETRVEPGGGLDNPVTATIGVGGVVGGPEPSAAPDPEPAGSSSSTAGLVALVLGAAALLGAGGITGLYLTRHGHAH